MPVYRNPQHQFTKSRAFEPLLKRPVLHRLISISLIVLLCLPFNAFALTLAVDDFSSSTYSGGTGWSGDWIESAVGNFDNGPNCLAPNGAGGDDRICRHPTESLRFHGVNGPDPYISREIDLSDPSITFASLIFDLGSSGNLDGNGVTDVFRVRVSTNGGAWTVLATYANDVSLSNVTLDLTPYRSAATRIRFGVDTWALNDGEFYQIDNVRIHTVEEESAGLCPDGVTESIGYVGTLSGELYSINLASGATELITDGTGGLNSLATGGQPVNALAANSDATSGPAGAQVYYGVNQDLRRYQPPTGFGPGGTDHAFLDMSGVFTSGEELQSGGATYANGVLYIATEFASGTRRGGDLYAIEINDAGTALSDGTTTPVLGSTVHRLTTGVDHADFGDMIITDDGDNDPTTLWLYGSTTTTVGSPDVSGFWRYDLLADSDANTFSLGGRVVINASLTVSQLASDGNGNLFTGDQFANEVRLLDPGSGAESASSFPLSFLPADMTNSANCQQSLPVTLGSFESRLSGRMLTADWTTVSETFNVGFALWARIAGAWALLSPRPVLSSVTDAVTPQSYRIRVNLRDIDPDTIEGLALSSIDTSGREEAYGLFSIGEDYGVKALPAPIAWDRIRRQVDAGMRARGYIRVRDRWRRQRLHTVSVMEETSYPPVELVVREPGMQRITYEDLAAAGLDLEGVEPRSIAVSRAGEGVPRVVSGGRGGRGFGPGGFIDFWGEMPDYPDALYVSHYVYRVEVDETRTRSAGVMRGVAEDGRHNVLHPIRVNEDQVYSFMNRSRDPWYAKGLRHPWGPVEYAVELSVPDDFDGGLPGRLEVTVAGATSFPDVKPDHHVRLHLNGSLLADEYFDGNAVHHIDVEVPPGLFEAGDNLVQVVLGGGSQAEFDIVFVDAVTLWYPGALTASDNRVLVQGAVKGRGLAASGFERRPTKAYAHDAAGNLTRIPVNNRPDPDWLAELDRVNAEISNLRQGLSSARLDPENRREIRGRLRLAFAERRAVLARRRDMALISVAVDSSLGEGVEYWISDDAAMIRPEILGAVEVPELLEEEADLLVVAHPAFLPPSRSADHPLNRYVDHRRTQGWTVRVLSIVDIQNAYGGGMPLPRALTRFLAEADELFEFSHVLLVGGDSYDYLDRLGLGSVSFVPTVYAPTAYIQHTPSDALLADIDGDGFADKAIGRWPVRSLDDLEAIVTKTLDWDDPSYASRRARSSVWVADTRDEGVPSFSAQADRMIGLLRTPLAGGATEPWPEEGITRVYLDDLEAAPRRSIAETARETLFGALTEGRRITGFAGHGSPAAWTTQGLLHPRHVSDLYNEGFPTLITTLTCYTSYFVSPNSDTLASRLMRGYRTDVDGEEISGVANGAVALHGAATLSSYRDNEALAGRVLTLQLIDGLTLGEAIRQAQRWVSGKHASDVAINWILLGDPTLRIDFDR